MVEVGGLVVQPAAAPIAGDIRAGVAAVVLCRAVPDVTVEDYDRTGGRDELDLLRVLVARVGQIGVGITAEAVRAGDDAGRAVLLPEINERPD